MGGILASKPAKVQQQPSNDDAAVQLAADEARRRALSGGQQATVLTSGVGVTSAANKSKPTLSV